MRTPWKEAGTQVMRHWAVDPAGLPLPSPLALSPGIARLSVCSLSTCLGSMTVHMLTWSVMAGEPVPTEVPPSVMVELFVTPVSPRTTILCMFTKPFVQLLVFFAPLLTLEIDTQPFSLYVTETKWHGPPSKVLSSYKERALQKDGNCKDSPNKLSHVSSLCS